MSKWSQAAKKDFKVILTWPLEIVDDIQSAMGKGVAGKTRVEDLLPAVAALGVGYYFYGWPSLNNETKELAMQYFAIGGSYFAAQQLKSAETGTPN